MLRSKRGVLCGLMILALGLLTSTTQVQAKQDTVVQILTLNDDHWLVKGYKSLRDKFAPIPPPSPSESFFRSRRGITRYELSVQLSRLVKQIEVIDRAKKPNNLPTVQAEDRILLKRMIKELRNELFAHGYIVSPDQRIDRFPDVPATHWAYRAVTELKQKDILVGYPAEPENTFLLPEPKASKITPKSTSKKH